ncbi:Hypothetical protein, putative [Bodo saltans]|uniref:Calponin-homology (CH) domain-containing protein n=1 Tax=Bodo saltans TaxID=75058 RepID=A0A0S4JNC7_BODSA|nr:Hypothetical protein, putative [Bodo saltans]|eukprot:CUG91711.1 Hypothetical protein, putative [Bodo saltans]
MNSATKPFRGQVLSSTTPGTGGEHGLSLIIPNLDAPSYTTKSGDARFVPTPPPNRNPLATNNRREIDNAIRSMEQWASANASETALFQDTIALAKDLFLTTIAGQYDATSATSRDEDGFIDADLMEHVAENAAADGATHLSAKDGTSSVSDAALTPRAAAIAEIMGTGTRFLKDSENYRETRNNVMRAAVSCLLLERMCSIFSRYHSVLGSINEMIFRSVFVPDTEEMRSVLGGTVQFPLHGVPTRYRALLAPYARKTYFVAHDEVAAQVMALAKSNRSIEMRLSRQGKIFDKTVKHWVAAIVRNLFLSWRSFTRKRNTLRQRFHHKFARLRVEELKVKVIQHWRSRAANVRRAAVMEAGAGELAQLAQSTELLNETITSLTDLNNNLAQRIISQEKERVEMQSAIAHKEKVFIDLQSRTAEMDRVGTELIDSMLQQEALPVGANAIDVLVAWAHRMIEDAGGAEDDDDEPLLPLLSDEFFVQVPLSALACVMLRFQSPNVPNRDEISALHNAPQRAPDLLVDMYERLVEGPCLVNSEQIGSMQRGVLLLFLAGLLRHMSNWTVCKPPPVPTSRKALNTDNKLLDAAATNIRRRSSVALRSAASVDSFHSGGGGSTQDTLVPLDELAPHHTKWVDRVKNQQVWIATSMAALHLALEVSTQRPPALTSEEQEDMVVFLDLSVSRLLDVLPQQRSTPQYSANITGGASLRSDTVFVQLLKSLQQLFPELRKVYLAYAVPAMHYMDFVRLVKDCRVLGQHKLSKKEVEAMCQYVYLQHNTKGGGGGKPTTGDSSQNRSTRLSPSEHRLSPGEGSLNSSSLPVVSDLSIKVMEPRVFVECTIRTAVLHHRRLTRDPELPLAAGMISSFILETIVPHALRLDVDRFRQTARHPLVRQVLEKHKVALRKAFRKYATANDGETIPRLQFQTMAKDCRWHTCKMISSDVILEVFRRCRSEADSDGGVEGLDFSDWQESLCALSVYADPNPLVPLAVKLPVFMEEKVLSVLML